MGSRTSKQATSNIDTWKLLSYWFQGVEKTVRATQVFFLSQTGCQGQMLSLQKGRILVCVLANKASGWFGARSWNQVLKFHIKVQVPEVPHKRSTLKRFQVPHKGSGERFRICIKAFKQLDKGSTLRFQRFT